jgi:hypothetical protein
MDGYRFYFVKNLKNRVRKGRIFEIMISTGWKFGWADTDDNAGTTGTGTD